MTGWEKLGMLLVIILLAFLVWEVLALFNSLEGYPPIHEQVEWVRQPDGCLTHLKSGNTACPVPKGV